MAFLRDLASYALNLESKEGFCWVTEMGENALNTGYCLFDGLPLESSIAGKDLLSSGMPFFKFCMIALGVM